MMALTTPVVAAIAVHWEVLCLLVMIVDVVVTSSKVAEFVEVLLVDILRSFKLVIVIINMAVYKSVVVHLPVED